MEIKKLKEKIKTKNFKIGIIGTGYVGLPLACEFAEIGIAALCFDVDNKKVTALNNGESYIQDISSEKLKPLSEKSLIEGTSDFTRLKEVDVISICVPTPLRKTKDPDMNYIFSAVKSIKENLKSGQVIILESTTYPGTTEEIVLPELESTGLKVGQDFFLAFSPERVDPGNETYTTKNTPKIIGGVTEDCTKLSKAVYEHAIETLVEVSSPKSAEMVKLYENTFRSVNIAMANEMVLICDKLGLDVWEIIESAATKPFGFMPFYPGPGLGGHCIPIDPHYLSWKLKTMDYDAKFIALAENINSYMPRHVVERIGIALNEQKKCINGGSILIIGIAYKPDINDMRESPATDIMSKLMSLGAKVSFHDNLNPSCIINNQKLTSITLNKKSLEKADCVVLISPHSDTSIETIVDHSQLLIDTRNKTKDFSKETIRKL